MELSTAWPQRSASPRSRHRVHVVLWRGRHSHSRPLSTAAHVVFASVWAYALGRYILRPSITSVAAMLVALGVAAALHGLFNVTASLHPLLGLPLVPWRLLRHPVDASTDWIGRKRSRLTDCAAMRLFSRAMSAGNSTGSMRTSAPIAASVCDAEGCRSYADSAARRTDRPPHSAQLAVTVSWCERQLRPTCPPPTPPPRPPPAPPRHRRPRATGCERPSA